ncbi:hypothetical protein SDC9_118539 [bioreactor metagenome]|uniref:Uncharacterized protein n=1 Tax=bioreactor metagenome TaxID=1076179 RepID=A0A645C3P7_9ZZZZ
MRAAVAFTENLLMLFTLIRKEGYFHQTLCHFIAGLYTGGKSCPDVTFEDQAIDNHIDGVFHLFLKLYRLIKTEHLTIDLHPLET